MKFSYYPGCTLKTKAKELDAFGRLSAAKLGVELEEIEKIEKINELAARYFEGEITGSVTYFYGLCGKCKKSQSS